ncbi:MAG: hypothetical protein CO162_04430 [bacterium (Candidatus Ratteibacteria) CG_4_9_14_3_um_filter_41_21]|uniref:CBS domain-containing protein n=1 Tax=bacterium (Candidatus Ratteibacteria) CG_4_9_14_3_um_filter_41_21 TaxID=2014289 RepID=A0A2M7YFP6_9BACT|nr:MAG: hypothetical protein CO162_04430 [bacterium (Candidatus Ratteibacteria) CG_4_9_14_3_um_filter_41_21]HCG77048.1 hypothetical protein [bacterium]
MLVKNVMRKDVITVERATTLRELMNIFHKYTFHTIPVIEDEKIIGIVELEHLCRVFQPHPLHIHELLKTVPFLQEEERDIFELDITAEMAELCLVDDIMERKFLTVKENATVQEAQRLMKLHQTQRLLVVNKKNNLMGMINLFDIILSLFKEKGIY